MPKSRSKIAIIFAGGATLEAEGKRLISVTSENDIEAWLSHVPELSLIADIDPIFLFGDGKDLDALNWNLIASTIQSQYGSCDGVVVLNTLDSMLYVSAAMSFILNPLGKPVVFTGSPLSPRVRSEKDLAGFISHYRSLGVRANLINATQVATLDCACVSILFGNLLLRANRSRKSFGTSFNVFEADDADILGSVDFGIKLKDGAPKRKGGNLKLQKINDNTLAVVRLHPNYRVEEFSTMLRMHPEAILIHTYMQTGVKDSLRAHIRIAHEQGIPVVVFNPFIGETMQVPGALVVSGIPYETLYAKLQVALSRNKKVHEVESFLLDNVAGEFGEKSRQTESI